MTRRTPRPGDSYSKGSILLTVRGVDNGLIRIREDRDGELDHFWSMSVDHFQHFIAYITWGRA